MYVLKVISYLLISFIISLVQLLSARKIGEYYQFILMKTTIALIIGVTIYAAGIFTGNAIAKNKQKTSNNTKNAQNVSKSQTPQERTLKQAGLKHTFRDSTVQEPIRRIQYPHFKIIYSTYHKCPLAVHQLLTPQLIANHKAKRVSYFKQPKIQPQFQVSSQDYQKSKGYKYFKYQVGHMAPAANYGTQQDKNDTFTMANMVPQHQSNNIGIWKTFEVYQRNLLLRKNRKMCDSVQIVSGPIFYKNKPLKHKVASDKQQVLHDMFKVEANVLMKNGVVVPQKLYKIIKCNKNERVYLQAFEFENSYVQSQKGQKNNKQRLKNYVKPVQQIQNQTGLKFNLGTYESLLDYDDFQGAFQKN